MRIIAAVHEITIRLTKFSGFLKTANCPTRFLILRESITRVESCLLLRNYSVLPTEMRQVDL